MADESRTEAATPRQRQRARERGQVARSVELVSAVILFAAFALLALLDRRTQGGFSAYFRETLGKAAEVEVTPEGLPALIRLHLSAAGALLLPLIGGTALAALLVSFLQVGLHFSAQPLNPDFQRLDPVKGAQRMFSMRALVELLKSSLKVAIVGSVCWGILSQAAPGLLATLAMEPLDGAEFARRLALKIAFSACGLLLILALLDYLYQRYEFEKSIKMSKQEVKEEFKNQEGDPLIKRRIREMGRKIAMSRMFEQLKQADAVITNPTHYAVALRYELDWPAPKLLAKGKDYIAQRIIRYAREQGIPVYEQPWLARALYKTEVDEFIPQALFKAVAKILAQISRHDAKLRAKFRGARA